MLSSHLQLILDQAIATIDCSDAEREQFRRRFYPEQTYHLWLQQQGVTADQFETWLDRELSIRKFQMQRWGKRVSSYFLQRKHQLDQVICSLIYVSDDEMAQELYFRIVEGEQSFGDVARLYSQGPEAETGGRIGPIELGQLHPKIAQRFYGGRPGQLWDPFRADEWVVIAQLEARLPVQFDDFMRQSLLNELLESWLQEQAKQQFPFG